MRPHYHVISGMFGGYLPDESFYCATKRQALAVLRSERDYIDDVMRPNRTIMGAASRGVYTWADRDDPYDLGYYVEIVRCDDEACADEEE